MSHRFLVSPELQAQFEGAAARVFFDGRHSDFNRFARIVKQNDQFVAEGSVPTAEGPEPLPPPRPAERVTESTALPEDAPFFEVTEICVANVDTVSAAMVFGDACALNFANAQVPGGGYRYGARAQEEDLCRLLPQLIHSLEACEYPIRPEECLLSRGLMSVRDPVSYSTRRSAGEVDILTSAMPCGDGGYPGSEKWNNTVRMRIRAVLHAARVSGRATLVLGAWGCGAFGNPPDLVARLFREQLEGEDCRGAFRRVVFAIIDPGDDGNLGPFQEEVAKMGRAADPSPG